MVDNESSLVPFADGVWLDTEPVRIVGMRLATTMTVLRLGDGSLLVHSPVPLTPPRREAIDKLGPVAHLYSPNTFHHFWIGEWAAAFPNARVHAPRGLATKRRDLRIDRFHGASPEPAFAGVIDEIAIDGFRLEENAIAYLPARTLVVADLVHNVGTPPGAWTQLYTRAMGFYDRVAVSRVIRSTAFNDRRAARKSVDAVLARSFDRMIVGHGAPLVSGAHDALASAYAWMA